MISQAQELEVKTAAYWKLSQVWNGKREAEITTGESIELCTTIIAHTNYSRPLSHCVDSILQEIIKGEGNQKALRSKILPFQKPKKKVRSTK